MHGKAWDRVVFPKVSSFHKSLPWILTFYHLLLSPNKISLIFLLKDTSSWILRTGHIPWVIASFWLASASDEGSQGFFLFDLTPARFLWVLFLTKFQFELCLWLTYSRLIKNSAGSVYQESFNHPWDSSPYLSIWKNPARSGWQILPLVHSPSLTSHPLLGYKSQLLIVFGVQPSPTLLWETTLNESLLLSLPSGIGVVFFFFNNKKLTPQECCQLPEGPRCLGRKTLGFAIKTQHTLCHLSSNLFWGAGSHG